MKIMPKVIAITSVALLVISFGAEAKKDRMAITDCVCDETVTGTFDCTVDFDGVPGAIDDDYHGHVTTEQDGFSTVDPFPQASCKAQTQCEGLVFNDPDYTFICTGAALPDPACTDLLEDGFFFGIVAKVAADADPEAEAHGKATRFLKDNYPNCTINEFVPEPT
jgi:hypothetical protein